MVSDNSNLVFAIDLIAYFVFWSCSVHGHKCVYWNSVRFVRPAVSLSQDASYVIADRSKPFIPLFCSFYSLYLLRSTIERKTCVPIS